MARNDWRYRSPPWPVPYVGIPLDISKSGLVIVDVQRYWTDPEGPLGTKLKRSFPESFEYFYARLGRTVIPNIARLIAGYRKRELPIVHVVSGTARADGKDLAAHLQRRIGEGEEAAAGFHLLRIGSEWHQAPAELAPEPGELIVNKTSRSAFSSTGIDQLLGNLGVAHLTVTGLATNGCVDLTARDAADRGYETFLVEDGCATFTEEAHVPVLQAFQEVFGTVLNTDEVIRSLSALDSSP